MNKTIASVFLLLFTSQIVNSQLKYSTRTGTIAFDSKLDSFVPIKAKNVNVSSILNLDNGHIAVLALVKEFRFKNSLMEEHFNENYAESDFFSKATFYGKIINFELFETNDYMFNGVISFHGVKKSLEILNKELDMTMALCGKKDISLVGRDIIKDCPFFEKN